VLNLAKLQRPVLSRVPPLGYSVFSVLLVSAAVNILTGPLPGAVSHGSAACLAASAIGFLCSGILMLYLAEETRSIWHIGTADYQTVWKTYNLQMRANAQRSSPLPSAPSAPNHRKGEFMWQAAQSAMDAKSRSRCAWAAVIALALAAACVVGVQWSAALTAKDSGRLHQQVEVMNLQIQALRDEVTKNRTEADMRKVLASLARQVRSMDAKLARLGSLDRAEPQPTSQAPHMLRR